MALEWTDTFCWFDRQAIPAGESAAEQYSSLVRWASKARGKNPCVFDALTDWLLEVARWADQDLSDNERIVRGIFQRFKEQNAWLRAVLSGLEPSGVVNPAVFKALDRFDDVLSGVTCDKQINDAATHVFADFSVLRERSTRELFAGNPTGPTGTWGVSQYGYINCLKDCDAGVQWALFMPALVNRQQKGFQVTSFSVKSMPAMRFIGREGDDLANLDVRRQHFRLLDALDTYRSAWAYDVLLMHHNGQGVDTGPWHGVWGRFMQAETPVPEGCCSIDFIPDNDGQAGPPYLAHFAFATFSGDSDAMHAREGFDSDAMYDVTRNIMLGQGVPIPYPSKYWTAEVFLNGCDKGSSAYMFSAEPNNR